GMERPAFIYLESADHPQTEEILVKSPRLLGITAAISIVVQPLDHPTLLRCNQSIQLRSLFNARATAGRSRCSASRRRRTAAGTRSTPWIGSSTSPQTKMIRR